MKLLKVKLAKMAKEVFLICEGDVIEVRQCVMYTVHEALFPNTFFFSQLPTFFLVASPTESTYSKCLKYPMTACFLKIELEWKEMYLHMQHIKHEHLAA